MTTRSVSLFTFHLFLSKVFINLTYILYHGINTMSILFINFFDIF
nr:MAG TPA: hypothetical protein [Caudoviricetes sp.]